MTHYSRTLTSEAHYDDRSCARPLFRPAFLFRIAVADPGVCVTGMIPPLELVPILKTYMQSVRDRDRSPPPPPGMWMTSHGQCPRGGVLVNVSKSGGVFQFFGGQMTSRGQCQRGGGCLWMSSLRLDRDPSKSFTLFRPLPLCKYLF